MRALWNRISHWGIYPTMPPFQERAVLLCNRMALIVFILSLVLYGAMLVSLKGSASSPLVLFSVVFYVVVLLLNKHGYINASRLAMSLFVPVATLIVTLYAKLYNPVVEEFMFFTSRVVLLISCVIPLAFFSLQERKLLLLGLSGSFLCLLLYDPIHELFGVGYYQLGYTSPSYGFTNFLMLILYCLLISAFAYYKYLLEKAEQGLWSGNQQLSKLYNELGRQHEEIHAQSEKLVANQQKLQEANQLIEQQKGLLEAENIELHQHLLEKNTILEASNRELHKRLEEMQQFSYTISHNLRGPVASLLGLASLFDLEKADEDNRVLMIHAKTSAEALDMVIRDLSQVLQIREGRQVSERADLENLLESVLLSLKQEKEACNTEIYQSLSVKQLYGVKSYLHSILYNLLNNAFKYRHPERSCTICIRSRQVDKGVLLEVEDNGTGIDLERHGNNLFKMYKRFHENREGRGLGLYLIKTQAEILGGYVEVKSEPDVGTTFSVWLPQPQGAPK